MSLLLFALTWRLPRAWEEAAVTEPMPAGTVLATVLHIMRKPEAWFTAATSEAIDADRLGSTWHRSCSMRVTIVVLSTSSASGAGMSARGRWVLASALGVVAALAVAGAITAGNNPKHYVHLMPYGRPGAVVTVLVVAPLLLEAAAWLVLRNRIARGISAGIAVVLALAMCAEGARFTAGADSFGTDPRRVTVLGVGPGGRFELVRLQFSSIGLGADIVRVRSREGLRSREAGQDLACFVVPFDHDAAPERTFASARFVGGTTVEVTTADGTAWTTAFDQQTLLAAQTLSYCRD
nr:hypothetical protein GCM10020063_022240 [Dactylosporangium thailandense]